MKAGMNPALQLGGRGNGAVEIFDQLLAHPYGPSAEDGCDISENFFIRVFSIPIAEDEEHEVIDVYPIGGVFSSIPGVAAGALLGRKISSEDVGAHEGAAPAGIFCGLIDSEPILRGQAGKDDCFSGEVVCLGGWHGG